VKGNFLSDLIIQTPSLNILRFAEEHLNRNYVSWLNDSETMLYSEQRHRKHTLESCRAYWKSFENSENLFLAIILKNNKKHIGNITVSFNTHNSLANVSIMLGLKEVRGKGYGLEAWQGVLNYLFQVKKLRKVEAGMMDTNLPMKSLAKKSGMIADGRRKKHYIWNNFEVDVVYYTMFRDMWIGAY